MSAAARMLAEFHTHPHSMGHGGTNGMTLRRTLHEEEHAELLEELDRVPPDRAKIARELADVVYVAYGTAWAYGIDLDAALFEIHRAAMDKMRAGLRREDGKILKPPGFIPPDMTAAIAGPVPAPPDSSPGDLPVRKSADISPCGTYRYALRRIWDEDRPPVLFIGLNPSTADAENDDPTIRRCVGFARAWGAGGLTMANLYAYRSTDPKGLLAAEDPIGPENDTYLLRLACTAARVIVAWGAWPGPDQHRPERVRSWLAVNDVRELYALGLTKSGEPRHPLYMRADSVPLAWTHRPGAR